MSKILEDELPYKGPINDPDVKYSAEGKKGAIDKIIVKLKSFKSGEYTKLGRNLVKIDKYEKEIKKLKEEIKDYSKTHIADLFHAEDAAHTRVVETVGFIFKLTKDPEPSETFKYAQILKELEKKLTPELVVVLEELKKQFRSETQRSPGLSYTDKRMDFGDDDKIIEDIEDKLESTQSISDFAETIENWSEKYSRKLESLLAKYQQLSKITESDDNPVTSLKDLMTGYNIACRNIGAEKYSNLETADRTMVRYRGYLIEFLHNSIKDTSAFKLLKDDVLKIGNLYKQLGQAIKENSPNKLSIEQEIIKVQYEFRQKFKQLSK
jgi:hypothetical protein